MYKQMLWSMSFVAVVFAAGVARAEISGQYLETRTCQVYTGPCFANSEVGVAGKDAVMAWSIDRGEFNGVDLAGLKVVVALRTSETLGFEGINGAGDVKSVIIVDETAKGPRREALIEFAKQHCGKAGDAVQRVDSAPIAMSLDESELRGKLEAGELVKLETRRANKGDCICSNETAYYPPLTELRNFAPGVTMVGEFNGRGLGTQWSTPDSRSAYVATFTY